MKQSLKLGLLVVFALLLHSIMMKAADVTISVPTDLVHEECSLSQARPAYHNIHRFYIFYSEMPCEMGHADVSHIPADKSFIRFVLHLRKYKARNNHCSDYVLHPSIHTLSDPVSYYVFGLRKIIV